MLAACTGEAGETDAPPRVPPACVVARFEGDDFTHCTALPGRHTIRTVLGNPPYRDLSRFAAALGRRAERVAFAVNGGMYDEAGLRSAAS